MKEKKRKIKKERKKKERKIKHKSRNPTNTWKASNINYKNNKIFPGIEPGTFGMFRNSDT